MKHLGTGLKGTIAVLTTIFLLAGVINSANADISTKPSVISFTLSTDNIDLASSNTKIIFDLIVSNPTGIASTQTLLTITNGGANKATAQ